MDYTKLNSIPKLEKSVFFSTIAAGPVKQAVKVKNFMSPRETSRPLRFFMTWSIMGQFKACLFTTNFVLVFRRFSFEEEEKNRRG